MPKDLDVQKTWLSGDLDVLGPGSPKDLNVQKTWMSGDLDVLGPGSPKDLDVQKTWMSGDLDVRDLSVRDLFVQDLDVRQSFAAYQMLAKLSGDAGNICRRSVKLLLRLLSVIFGVILPFYKGKKWVNIFTNAFGQAGQAPLSVSLTEDFLFLCG